MPVRWVLGLAMGSNAQVFGALREVNKAVLKSALHQCKGITLDIDATEIISHKADAKWTYNKNKGYMPDAPARNIIDLKLSEIVIFSKCLCVMGSGTRPNLMRIE